MTPHPCNLRTVAALYVMDRSVYHDLPFVDAWPRSRDANAYPGPFPIVAHPPCSAWSRLWNCHRSRSRPGCGDTTGIQAVTLVRRFGGILEQPAGSQLWPAAYLPDPGGPDLWGGETIVINQSEWGHPSTKPTWLYICRADPLPPPPQPGRVGKRLDHCSKNQKFATPPLLALALVTAARSARPFHPP